MSSHPFIRPTTFVILSALVASACANATSVHAPVDGTQSATPHVDADHETVATTIDRFPGGPGASITSDQLTDALRASDRGLSYDERIANIRQALGDPGQPFENGTIFYGLSPRTNIAPYGCMSLTIKPGADPLPTYISMVAADFPKCGLPYVQNPEAPYKAKGPTRTFTQAMAVAKATEDLPPSDAITIAKMKLGAFALRNGVPEWLVVGARSDDAPISCWSFSIGEGAGDTAKRRIERVELDRCGFEWPPSADAAKFHLDADAPVGEMAVDDEQSACATTNKKCSASELCLVQEWIPRNASILFGSFRKSARYADGQPAELRMTSSCIAAPPDPNAYAYPANLSWCPREGLMSYTTRTPSNTKPRLVVCVNHTS